MKKFRCTVPCDRLAHGLTDRCGQNHCFADPPLHEGAFSHQVTCRRYLLQKVVSALTLVFTCGVWGNPRVKLVTSVTITTEAGQIVDHNIFLINLQPPNHSHLYLLSLLSFSGKADCFSKVGCGVVELVERLNTGLSTPPPCRVFIDC